MTFLFYFERDHEFFSNSKYGTYILTSVSFWPLLIIKLVARVVPASLVIR